MPSIADLVVAPALARLASAPVRARGDALARDGHVRITIFGPLSVAARVDGPEHVATSLTAAGESLRWTCTCAAGRGGAFCAHLVATARITWERAPWRSDG